MNRSHLGIALFAQVIAGSLHVFSRTTERHKHGVRIFGAVFLNQAVAAASELGKLLIALLQRTENMLIEIVPARYGSVHMMLLILHRAEQYRVFQVHHLRYTPALRSEEFALRLSGAINLIIRCSKIFAQQIRFRRAIGALGMRGQHPVLNIHAGIKRQFIGLAEDYCLICGLLGITAHQHRPASIHGGIKIIVSTVHVQRVLGERPGAHFQNHGRELAGRVIVLLHGIDNALAGGKVYRTLAGHGHGRGTTLRGVFALGFHRQLLVTPHIQCALRKGLLINLATLGRWCDGIKHSALGDAGFHPLRHQLVAVARYRNTRILGLAAFSGHGGRFLFCGLICHV